MTKQLSLRGILCRPRFMICIFGLIAAGIGCTGVDKPSSSDLTGQVLEKPGSSNPTAGRATSFSVQTSPEETDSGVRKGQEAKGDKEGKRQRRMRKNDGVDWRTAMATAPDEWSDELKSQITVAGYDLNEVAEKIGKRQEARGNQKGKSSRRKRKNDGVDWRTAMATAPDEWSDEMKSQITAAGYDLNEVAEKIVKRQEALGDKKGKSSRRKRKNDGVDWRTAMATAPDEWSDELKSQITAAGYDLNEVVERIQKRQNAKDAKGP